MRVIARYRDPLPGRTSVLLRAEIDGELVGAAEAHADPAAPAFVEIAVLPGYRRRGVGARLREAVRDRLHGVAEVVQAETSSDAGLAFARAAGMSIGVQEARQVLDLESRRDSAARPTVPAGVRLRSWIGSCPDELVADWALLRAGMTREVPVGELTRAVGDADADVDAVRRNERRMHEQGYLLVRSLAVHGDAGIGYTEIFLAPSAPEIVHQDDTFVVEAFRGRGVARALKAANLRQLLALPAAADSRVLQTYTALGNRPMRALNRSVGFRELDVLSVLEGPLG